MLVGILDQHLSPIKANLWASLARSHCHWYFARPPHRLARGTHQHHPYNAADQPDDPTDHEAGVEPSGDDAAVSKGDHEWENQEKASVPIGNGLAAAEKRPRCADCRATARGRPWIGGGGLAGRKQRRLISRQSRDQAADEKNRERGGKRPGHEEAAQRLPAAGPEQAARIPKNNPNGKATTAQTSKITT